jgi:hypothetical protein
MDRIIVFDSEYFLHIPVMFIPDGRACPYVAADSPIARTLKVYYSIQGDLQEVQAMINYLNSNNVIPEIVRTSMYKSIIIQYSKCYTQPTKGRKQKLESNYVFGDNAELMKTHKELMELRNTLVAHAGEGKYDNGEMVIQLNPDNSNKFIIASAFVGLKFMDHSMKLPGYAKICEYSLNHVNAKIERLLSEFDKELAGMDVEELYIKSKSPHPKDYRIEYNFEKYLIKKGSTGTQ